MARRNELWSTLLPPYGMLLLTDMVLLFPVQHGTGHGVGSYLTVHEGPHGFSSDKPLVPGHVVTNEPGYCKDVPFLLCYIVS